MGSLYIYKFLVVCGRNAVYLPTWRCICKSTIEVRQDKVMKQNKVYVCR
jgi:hypothetical protein